ncbi:MAG: DHH family phosphoesterase, partial [Firmicutes bacterium]|nr:DHH family phosphoesterase [Bacillota bacterium]
MQARWIFPDQLNRTQRWTFRDKEGVHPFVAELLTRRGIEGQASQEEFLSEKPTLTYDPFLLKGMEEGASMLLSAIEAGERICIYGDYDADGICATSLMLQVLGLLGAKTEYYIPSRFAEGYGLNRDAIADIHSRGVGMILTVDCGSVSVEEVEFAKSLGLKMLVTDHHSLGERICDCILINPKQPGCEYPEKELCGCGVAFKLAQALERKSEKLTKKDLNDVLDLVVMATMGDVVPLRGENRTLVKFGMKALNRRKRPGLDLLIRMAGLTPGEIKGDDIAYVIVPHLNAGGRMMTAKTAVDLLMAPDEETASPSVKLLLRNNQERKQAQEEALQKALKVIDGWTDPGKFILVDVPDAHEGIA